MAVLVQHDLARQRRRPIALLLEELGEVERLLREAPRVLVERPDLRQLVLEDGNAARLGADDRHARADLGAQRP